MTPDWRHDGPAWFELQDLTSISFRPIHPTATPGLHLPHARRPFEPKAERRIDRASRIAAVLAAIGMTCIGLAALRWALPG